MALPAGFDFDFRLTTGYKIRKHDVPLDSQDIKKLQRIVAIAEKLIANGAKKKSSGGNGAAKRRRRSGKELTAFRKMLKAERRKGVPVSELARKHGVSSAYIYQLP